MGIREAYINKKAEQNDENAKYRIKNNAGKTNNVTPRDLSVGDQALRKYDTHHNKTSPFFNLNHHVVVAKKENMVTETDQDNREMLHATSFVPRLSHIHQPKCNSQDGDKGLFTHQARGPEQQTQCGFQTTQLG